MNSIISDRDLNCNMKEPLFSKKTCHMLEDNGYSFRSNNDIHTFRHSSGTALGVSIVAVIVGAFNVFFIMLHPIPGIIALVMLIVATRTVIKKLVGKTLIMIDIKDQTFTINTPTYKADWNPVNQISEIMLKSKYVDEYTSAFKSTSEEHLITIYLRLKSGKEILLFKFSSDYAEPTAEINQVFEFLESAFGSKTIAQPQ